MKNLFTVRNIIIGAVILFFAAAVGYKYYEWSTLQSLSSLYNQTWTQEFSLVQNENKSAQPYLKVYNKIFGKDAQSDALVNNYNELNGNLQVIISNQEDYATLLKNDNSAYSNINTWFLFGKKGNFAKKIISDQKQYYQYEINDANIAHARYWLTYNLFAVIKDRTISTQFLMDTESDPNSLITQYWSNLSSLQKYTDSNYKFEHEDEIKKYYPNAYNLLKQYQSYFADFYNTMQNGETGDTTSLTYEIPALTERFSTLNFNISDIYNETQDQQNNNAKNIINVVSDESNNINNFETEKLSQYPFLPSIGIWKDNLVLCQMYDFKAGLYDNLTTQYVSASTPSALLSELSTVPPNTQPVDKHFDTSVMKIINNNKQIIFACTDKLSNTTYQFVTNK